MDNSHPFDLLDGEGFNLLFRIANELHPPDATSIREGEVFPVWFQLPSGLFVFHRAVIVLKLGIAFLARLMRFAVVIEAGDSEPCPVSRGLTSLGVEASSKGIRFGKDSTIALQLILVDASRVHPEAQA